MENHARERTPDQELREMAKRAAAKKAAEAMPKTPAELARVTRHRRILYLRSVLDACDGRMDEIENEELEPSEAEAAVADIRTSAQSVLRAARNGQIPTRISVSTEDGKRGVLLTAKLIAIRAHRVLDRLEEIEPKVKAAVQAEQEALAAEAERQEMEDADAYARYQDYMAREEVGR